MKILLVTPCIEKYLLKPGEKPKEVKLFRFSMLSVLTVAACTPKEHELKIIDEHIEAVDFDEDADVVGISFMTAEALEHCDAVVIGEAENSWPRVLRDIENNRLQRVYQSRRPVDLGTLQPVPRHLLRKNGYITVNTIQATRGCNNACEFCSVSPFYGRKQRFRPIDRVVEELESIPGMFVLFIDDNITGDAEYAKRLFRAMIPLRKKWISQASLKIADDEQLVQLAAKSGCCGLFVGLESINSRSLYEVEKGFNRTERYGESFRKLQDAGIGIETGLIFGFDHDDVSVFERTLDFLLIHNIDAIQVSALTPLPGTGLYEKMVRERRIIDHRWQHYDYRHVVFRPNNMRPEQLQNGVDWIIGEFYSTGNIARRVFSNFSKPNLFRNLFVTLPINIGYHRDARRWGIHGQLPTAKVLRSAYDSSWSHCRFEGVSSRI